MYSPFEAVQGHDRTFVQRMTLTEYEQELEEEEKELRGEASERGDAVGGDCPDKRKPRLYELRRAALTSRDPLVTFSSTFPMYDRLGRELSVLYQIHDWDIKQECDRLRQGGEEQEGRRSGVRLSNELCVDSLPTHLLSAPGKDSLIIEETEAVPKVGGEEEVEVDVSVSAMSKYSSYLRTHSVSAPPSEFSIYRDSVKTSALMETVVNGSIVRGIRKIESPRAEPFASVAPNLGIEAVATTSSTKDDDKMPFDPHRGKEHALAGFRPGLEFTEADLAQWPHLRKLPEDAPIQAHRVAGTKRARSTSRIGRVSYLEGYQEERDSQTAAALQRRPASSTPPPRPTTTRNCAVQGLLADSPVGEMAPGYDPIRLTTVRDSVVPRTTTQLFRPTCGGTQAGRCTTTLAHTHLISSTTYGLQASAIAASKVHSVIEDNYRNFTASYHTLESFPDTPMPELRCGLVIQLGCRWFQLLSLFVVAEVYEVVEVHPPRPKCETNASEPHFIPDGQATTSRRTPLASVTASEAGTTQPLGAGALEHKGGEPKLAVENECSQGRCPRRLNASDVVCVPILSGGPQTLLYRWRANYLPFKGKESRRAALGLSLAAPEVSVDGFDFADGGLTLLTIPQGYRAVSMSSLPLSTATYVTLLKTVLRLLSFMVARRIVHGNMTSLGELLLVHPVGSAGASREDALSPNSLATLPIVVPIHWERSIDFSMFVDRNAGRTIPYDTEDGSERPLLVYGRDLASVLNCFLDHRLSKELNSEQYALLQRLIIMTGEPTQVANFLVQIKNIMNTLTTDLVELQKALKAVVSFYSGDA